MKITKSIMLTAILLASGTAFAYSPDELEKGCQKPKFTDFTLTEYKASEQNEIAPETEFSFKVSIWTHPESIKLTAKKQPLAFTVESNSSFHKVKAKIPAEFAGKFLRLNVSAKVMDGECHEETGWLLKIADKAPAAETVPVATETAPPVAVEATPAAVDTTPAVPATTEVVK